MALEARQNSDELLEYQLSRLTPRERELFVILVQTPHIVHRAVYHIGNIQFDTTDGIRMFKAFRAHCKKTPAAPDAEQISDYLEQDLYGLFAEIVHLASQAFSAANKNDVANHVLETFTAPRKRTKEDYERCFSV